MADNLNIVSSELLSEIKEQDVNSLINQMIEKSKDNIEEISELTLECTTLLASAESRTAVLDNQSTFARLLGNITGKNRKLQNAILQDNTNALYAAQQVINRVMYECVSNRKLLLAVNDRISDLYLELKENQQDIAATVAMTRQAIANFYEKYQEEILKQDERISQIEEYAKVRCPKCQTELFSWQRVCHYCGYIHPLKMKGVSESTQKKLLDISAVVKDQKLSEDIVWNEIARKKEKVLRKTKTLASIGEIPGFTSELEADIDNLIHKCKSAEFQIAVVGVMKAGKSFLMNALIGAEIASVEVNPETAALTKFRSANGYYVIVRFHNAIQWEKLKESAKHSKKEGKDSFLARLNDPATVRMEAGWVGHDELVIHCSDLKELQSKVKKYTSSQTMEHLFVSEVEVGVDKSIFNMPKEVVFVDTPGLKDPVRYRSNITKKYIKKADAVLIALKPGPFTAEGLEIVTTVLDCTETSKAYIIGTQKDLNSEEECKKYVSNWVGHLVDAKRYSNKRKVMSRIILTSAKMELLVNKWNSLSENEKADEDCFSTDDYNDLESFSGKTIKKRGFNLMQITADECEAVSKATGIPALRDRLANSLISNYRKLKMDDIEKTFAICRQRIMELSKDAIAQKNKSIELAVAGAEEIQNQIHNMNREKMVLKQDNLELRQAAEKLENEIRNKIKALERKEI